MLTRDDPNGCWLPAGDEIEERIKRLFGYEGWVSRDVQAAVSMLERVVATEGIITIEMLNRAALAERVDDPEDHYYEISIEIDGAWRSGRGPTLPLTACRALLYGSQGSNGRN